MGRRQAGTPGTGPAVHHPFPADYAVEVHAKPPTDGRPVSLLSEDRPRWEGSLVVEVTPRGREAYLLRCGGPGGPTLGAWTCPDPRVVCIVAAGAARLVDAFDPVREPVLLGEFPVQTVLPAVDRGLLLVVGCSGIVAVGSGGIAWHASRLMTDGPSEIGVGSDRLWGVDRVQGYEFTVDLATGEVARVS